MAHSRHIEILAFKNSRWFEVCGVVEICSVFNFAPKMVVIFVTFLYSPQNSRSSDICGILMFVAKSVA